MKTTLLSETKKQFDNKMGKASIIKDKNLMNMKSAYKAMLRA